MVLQVKIPNIYHRDDHQPDSGTGGVKCKMEDRGGQDGAFKKKKAKITPQFQIS